MGTDKSSRLIHGTIFIPLMANLSFLKISFQYCLDRGLDCLHAYEYFPFTKRIIKVYNFIKYIILTFWKYNVHFQMINIYFGLNRLHQNVTFSYNLCNIYCLLMKYDNKGKGRHKSTGFRDIDKKRWVGIAEIIFS